MKKTLFYIAIMFPFILSGQLPSLDDTIRINEIVVSGRHFLSGPGKKMTVVDSAVLKDYSHKNISEVISENSSIFIKNYGSGGASTISLRGTGAGYTQMAWNGVSINSPMLGQVDLSLIPSGFIDEVNIFYGGASLYLGSGGIGGTINLATKPVWKDETDIFANISAGSFGKYSSLLKVRTGTSNFQSVTKTLFQKAENNFPFLNNFSSINQVSEIRKSASTNLNSLMQELYFRNKKNILSARIWYQSALRNIPVPIINKQPVNGENQKDESFRSVLSYSTYNGTIDFNNSLSWFSENMNYINPLLSTNSRNLSNKVSFKSGFSANLSEKTSVNIDLGDEICIINSVNYDGKKSRNIAGITFSAVNKVNEKLSISALLRETLKDDEFLIPDFSGGLQYRMIRNMDGFINISFSHNSRVPSMNDMYWNPGGNPLLKNENSYSGELSYELNSRISPCLRLYTQVSLYDMSILNMIKWSPVESGFWSPSNIDRANSSGAEGNMSLTYSQNNFKLKFSTKYSWNHSSILNAQASEDLKGKQLVYMPEHLFNGSARASYKDFYFTWISSFTSKRFTSSDNSSYLPGYLLSNLSAGSKVRIAESSVEVNLKVDNIFNVNYQTIAWYPMPGRAFMISLIYQFAK